MTDNPTHDPSVEFGGVTNPVESTLDQSNQRNGHSLYMIGAYGSVRGKKVSSLARLAVLLSVRPAANVSLAVSRITFIAWFTSPVCSAD